MILIAKQLHASKIDSSGHSEAPHEAGGPQVVEVVVRNFLLHLVLFGRPELFREACVMSVDPADGHPLWGHVDLLQGPLQDPDRLIDVVVHDGQIEEVPVSLF